MCARRKGAGKDEKGAENGFGKAVSFAGRVKSFWAESKGFFGRKQVALFDLRKFLSEYSENQKCATHKYATPLITALRE